MKHDFQVGDRVRILHSQDDLDPVIGTEGTVCHVIGDKVGVEHDAFFDRMHTCLNHCIDKHGWYYLDAAYKLEKINAEPLRIDTIDDLI
jgi:hypothetical protein